MSGPASGSDEAEDAHVLASLYGLSNAPSLSWLTNGWLVIISFIIGIGFNAGAVRWLRGLV